MYSIGIDIGGMSAKLGLVSSDKAAPYNNLYSISSEMCTTNYQAMPKVFKEHIIPTDSSLDYESFITDVCDIIKHLRGSGDVSKVGISSFGLIDSRKGKIVYANNIKWENKDIVSDIADRIHLPVKIANDAKCAALAEAVYGAGREYERVCMITLGTGVGGAFITNKQLDSGNAYSDADGILGHITVVNQGRQCTCGRRGCLEAYSSAAAIMHSYKERTGSELNVKDIFNKAREGYGPAAEAVNEFKYYLGEGLTSIVNMLRPEIIVIGGGVAGSADVFLEYLREYVNSGIYGGTVLPVKIMEARLGNEAGMIGAALL